MQQPKLFKLNSEPATLKRTLLADYAAPHFLVPKINLHFVLNADTTTVTSRLTVTKSDCESDQPLILFGTKLELVSIHLNDNKLVYDDYRFEGENLIIDNPPDEFELRIVNRIQPSTNKALLGLYVSGNTLTTQCEAEGFRAITYFPDRPDVLSEYTVTLEAQPSVYAVLLSNGELIDSGTLENGRHYATWHDPSPKPCYLFALVAGRLDKLSDEYITGSGRSVQLEFYAESNQVHKCEWAMDCLKRAMLWDEQNYGREYELNRYMVVAVDDFNMGAMENKGLNIFNSKYVYAKPETATDLDYHSVEAVIAHEYFHNWSGNRVTLRDWFQLSLKEGFTIYREQQFSADMGSKAVQRIRDANMIKVHQFREDQGPTSHPVQPDSYVTINNFYTLTIYNKGAELIRMMHVLLGADAYRKGTDLYFSRHNGSAVTIEEFVRALEDASGFDLDQFRHWYKTKGTPTVIVERQYDHEQNIYSLTFEQSIDEATEHHNGALQIPIQTALLASDGRKIDIRLTPNPAEVKEEVVLQLNKRRQTFSFYEVAAEPVPSLLRGFSAPVELVNPLSNEELQFLIANDTDSFCRWDASQIVAKNHLLELIASVQNNSKPPDCSKFLSTFESVLTADDDPALKAQLLTLPSEIAIGQAMDVVDPKSIHHARKTLVRLIANTHFDSLMSVYQSKAHVSGEQYDGVSAGHRSLRNLCLSYLIAIDSKEIWDLAYQQFLNSRNMTDRAEALQALTSSNSPMRQSALDQFFDRYVNDSLVIDKWYRIQATASRDDTLQRVVELTQHSSFRIDVPNRVIALIGGFCFANPSCFHAKDGFGYDLLADYIQKIDPSNPQLAARLADGFSEIRRYGIDHQDRMLQRLNRITSGDALSVDLAEVIEMILKPFYADSQVQQESVATV